MKNPSLLIVRRHFRRQAQMDTFERSCVTPVVDNELTPVYFFASNSKNYAYNKYDVVF